MAALSRMISSPVMIGARRLPPIGLVVTITNDNIAAINSALANAGVTAPPGPAVSEDALIQMQPPADDAR